MGADTPRGLDTTGALRSSERGGIGSGFDGICPVGVGFGTGLDGTCPIGVGSGTGLDGICPVGVGFGLVIGT